MGVEMATLQFCWMQTSFGILLSQLDVVVEVVCKVGSDLMIARPVDVEDKVTITFPETVRIVFLEEVGHIALHEIPCDRISLFCTVQA